MNRFRAVWPIVDETIPFPDLCREANAEIPRLAAQARAQLTRVGRFLIAPSDLVPGSGRVTAWALVYEAPATPVKRSTITATSERERTYATNDHRACPRCGIVRDARPASLCNDCEPLARAENPQGAVA